MNRTAWCEPIPLAFATTLRVDISEASDEAGTRPPSARALDIWHAMQRDNPRLFNGPILSLVDVDLSHGALRARRSSYMWHAVGDAVSTGVRLLAVTGVLVMQGSDGRDRVHLGRRSAQSHMYPGMWEFGPSGGLSPPPAAALTFADIVAELHREIREELGGAMELHDAAAVALCHDTAARSVDIVVMARAASDVNVHSPIDGEEHWEYEDAAWVARDDLAVFASRHSCIATTLAIARQLKWLPPHP